MGFRRLHFYLQSCGVDPSGETVFCSYTCRAKTGKSYAPGDYLKVEFRDDDGVMDRRVNLLRSIPKRHLDAGDGPIGGDGGKVVRETSVDP